MFRACQRLLAVVLVCSLLSTSLFVSFARAQATAAKGTPMLRLWVWEDFEAWENGRSGAHAAVRSQQCSHRGKETSVFIIESRDFERWLANFDQQAQSHLRGHAIFVQGAEMPPSIQVVTASEILATADNQVMLSNETLAIDQGSEYVVLVLPSIICKICKWLVGLIISCLFYDYVYLPYKPMVITWLKTEMGSCGHTQQQTYVDTTTTCPYIQYCLGTWQRVISTAPVQCECACGALWYVSAPY
jgi:hypothetical protein